MIDISRPALPHEHARLRSLPAPAPARPPSLVVPAVHRQQGGNVVLVRGTEGAALGPPHRAGVAVLPERGVNGAVCHYQRRVLPVQHKPLAAWVGQGQGEGQAQRPSGNWRAAGQQHAAAPGQLQAAFAPPRHIPTVRASRRCSKRAHLDLRQLASATPCSAMRFRHRHAMRRAKSPFSL